MPHTLPCAQSWLRTQQHRWWSGAGAGWRVAGPFGSGAHSSTSDPFALGLQEQTEPHLRAPIASHVAGKERCKRSHLHRVDTR